MDHRIFEGVLHGIFGGLFGPAITKWLSRFRYWIIFLLSVLGTYLGIFILGIYEKGWEYAVSIGLKRALETDSFLAVVGIALLAVFVAFIGSLSATKKPRKDEQDKNA